jgi:hypothetical protein
MVESGVRNPCETEPINASRNASASSRILALCTLAASCPVTTATMRKSAMSMRWIGLWTRKS